MSSKPMAIKVLLADQDDNLLISLEYVLQRIGLEVIKSRDSGQMVRMAELENPELIIADALMPGLSGFELCQQLRASSICAETPIILLSGRARDTDITKAKALGADALLIKPFPIQSLIDEVERLTEQTQ
ncbi:MAG: response regulator [Wenzhouxiangella sp.]|nr:response regulator [Wenzhouxiangella sp.]